MSSPLIARPGMLFVAILCVGAFRAAPASATADALYVNHATRQLAVFGDDEFTGFFWRAVAGEEGPWSRAEAHYLAKGYAYTRRPLLLDGLLFLLVASGLVFGGIRLGRRQRKRRVSRRAESRTARGR